MQSMHSANPLCLVCGSQRAPLPTIAVIDHEPNYQPDHEANPGDHRQTGHEATAQDNGSEREPWNQRNAKSARAGWLIAAEKNHTQWNQNKFEQRANI